MASTIVRLPFTIFLYKRFCTLQVVYSYQIIPTLSLTPTLNSRERKFQSTLIINGDEGDVIRFQSFMKFLYRVTFDSPDRTAFEIPLYACSI